MGTMNKFQGYVLATALSCCLVSCSPNFLSAQEKQSGTATKVGVIETAELRKLVLERLAEEKKAQAAGQTLPPAQFVLVDVRSEREMAVSVIPGAISKAEFERNLKMYTGKVVIPYCTVGGRCGEFSRQLAQSGWTVRSYRGSIIDWVQNELPLTTPKGQSTNQLHTNGRNFDLPANYQPVTK